MAVLLPDEAAGALSHEIQSRLNENDYYLQPSDIHVLLVDDEQLSRLVVGNLLRKCNYKGACSSSTDQQLHVNAT
jgi:response regulator RpfG family c-di-GMP phosphodiesterase